MNALKKSTAVLLSAIIIILNIYTAFAVADDNAYNNNALNIAYSPDASESSTTSAPFKYIHDPMENPKAAEDIIVNPNAVYGYSPNPGSKRLGPYAQYDWSDPNFVAEMRQEREAYHESVKELYQIKETMKAEGRSVEEIARAVSTRRNEIRMESYKDDPEGLEKLKQSNLATYGNENGGTPEYFYQKYGSWETVIEKSFSTNAGADACLGLYDKYYDTYFIPEPAIDPSEGTEPVTETAEPSESSEPTEPTETEPATELTEPATQPATDITEPTAAAVKKTSPKPNPIKVSAKKIMLKAKKLKSQKCKVKPLVIKNAKGSVKTSIIKSRTTASIRKKISINKNVLTFKKGKYGKKTYKIALKIYVKGNKSYKSKTIQKTVKVKVT